MIEQTFLGILSDRRFPFCCLYLRVKQRKVIKAQINYVKLSQMIFIPENRELQLMKFAQKMNITFTNIPEEIGVKGLIFELQANYR